jgi:site-specific recombinase XerD
MSTFTIAGCWCGPQKGAGSGIRRRMSVHSLRHTFATLLYAETGDLLLVNRALGHRDIRSTQRYVHVEDRRLVDALNRL